MVSEAASDRSIPVIPFETRGPPIEPFISTRNPNKLFVGAAIQSRFPDSILAAWKVLFFLTRRYSRGSLRYIRKLYLYVLTRIRTYAREDTYVC